MNRDINISLGESERQAVRLEGDRKDRQGGLVPHQAREKTGETH